MAENIYEMLMGSEPDAQESAKTLAEAIRRKRLVGGMGLAGSKRSQAIGAAELGEAKQDENLLEGAAKARLQYGAETQDRKLKNALDVMNARMEAMKDISSSRNQAMLEAARARYEGVMQGREEKTEKDSVKRLSDWVGRVNPLRQSSRGVLGRAGEVERRGYNILRLLGEGRSKEELDKINPQWANEAGIALASMVSGGYAPAVTTIKMVEPKSLEKNIAEWQQYLTGAPQNAKLGSMLKMIVKAVEREQKGARVTAVRNFLTENEAYPDVMKAYPERVKEVAKQLGAEGYLGPDMRPNPGVVEALLEGLLPEEVQQSGAGAQTINSEQEYNALPSGTEYIHGPTGQRRRKK